jgi:phage/plasmid-like protein (TIGR03299 family)
MSHEIEMVNGEAAIFVARKAAWHGLGTVTEDVVTAADAIRLAKLDWTVSLKPAYQQRSNGEFYAIPNRFVTTRSSDEKALGVVGKVYTPFQNVESFDFMDTLVDDGGAKFASASSLKGGKVVFITMEIPTGIKIGGNDPLNLYLLLSNSHDGSTGVRVDVTPVRVVCWNTLNMAWGNTKATWQVRHNGKLAGKIASARETLKLTFDYMDEFEDIAGRLAAVEVENELLASILTETLPEQKGKAEKIGNVINHRMTTPTLTDDVRLTGWGALNATSEYFEHILTPRNLEGRFVAQTFGTGAAFRTNVSKKLLLVAGK